MCVFVFQLHAIFRFYVCDIAHLQAVCQVNCFSCCRRFLREELSRELSTDFVLLHDPAEPRCKFMLFTVLFVCYSSACPSVLSENAAKQLTLLDVHYVRPALIACTYRSFVDPQSAVTHLQLSGAEVFGTTCRLTSQLRRHSRSSDSALRHFCSRAHTLTLSVNVQTMYFFYTCLDLAITSLFRPL